MEDNEEPGYSGNDNQNEKTTKQRRRKSKKSSSFDNDIENELDDKSTTTSFFSLCITGQIVSATFPLGPDKDYIFCRYELIAGLDWQLASGPQYGLTQMSTNRNGCFSDQIVFNMPIEVTYKSTSPFGWPQILVSVFGRSGTGPESLLGYARIHLPVFGSKRQAEHQQLSLNNVPILLPKCPNMLADMTSWLLRRQPELKDPKVLLSNLQCKGLAMESYGTLQFELHTIMRGARKLGYHWQT